MVRVMAHNRTYDPAGIGLKKRAGINIGTRPGSTAAAPPPVELALSLLTLMARGDAAIKLPLCWKQYEYQAITKNRGCGGQSIA